MLRRPPRSTPIYSSAASDVYKRQADRRRTHTRAPRTHARARRDTLSKGRNCMSTTGRPEDLHGEGDDLLALPLHPTPWLATGYRDENARLMVDAMYRHRDSLLRDCGDVPVQGYDVLPAEVGPSGALTCGTLISLWRGSALCR